MEQNELYQAIRKIAWGYVLIHVNLNINFSSVSFNILPNWLGYLFILRSLHVVAKEEEAVDLLVPLAKILVGTELLFWINDCCMGGYFNLYLIVMIARMIGLYFHFQLLTNLAEIAGKYNCEEEKKILVLRTVYTIAVTGMALFAMWAGGFQSYQISDLISLIPVLAFVAVSIWICRLLFSLSRSILEKQKELEVMNDVEEVSV